MTLRAKILIKAKTLKEGEYVRGIGFLTIGSVLANLISISLAPIQTRLYAPEHFAVMGVFTALVSTLAAAAGGRYEVASVVVKDDKDSTDLFVVSIWFAALVSIILFLILGSYASDLKTLLNAQELGVWWFFIPIAVFIVATNAAFKYSANRNKNYVLIGRMLILQAVVTNTCMIALGFTNFASSGLIFSMLLGTLCATIFFFRSAVSTTKERNFRISRSRLALARKFKRFPLHEGTTSLLNGVQAALPILFLVKHYPEEIVGYYVLLMKVMMSPLGILSGAVSQVHLRKTAELMHENADIKSYFLQLCLALVFVVSLLSVFLALTAPALFHLVFGEEWRQAGLILTILLPGLAIRFIASTVSGAITASGNTHLGAYWKIFAFAVTFFALWVAAGNLSIDSFFWVIMITEFTVYFVYLCVSYYSMRNPKLI
jgi:O-antigen/teichoic acid export membrane protein